MFSYGFYNSLNGDRAYDAVQLSSIFDGIIEDGVYSNVGEFFAVVPGTEMGVIVKTGRAWFDHTWSLNDSHLPISIDQADVLQTRIDAVILEVDARVEKRENSIKVVKGLPSVNPVKPTLLHSGNVFQHALAYVTVKPGATTITEGDIEIVVGKDETPFVQCPLKTVSIEDLFGQWDEEFNEWFDNVKLQLTDNVVTNLQRQIDEKVNLDDKATEEDIVNGTPDKWVDAKSVTPFQTQESDIKWSYRDLEKETNGQYIALDQRVVKKGTYPKLEKDRSVLSRVPNPTLLSWTAAQSFSGYCCSKYCGNGTYDYIVSSNQLTKIDSKTREKIAEVAGYVYIYYVDDNFIATSDSSKLNIYDLDLNLISSISFPDSSLQMLYIYVTNSKKIIIAGNKPIQYNNTSRSFCMYVCPPPYTNVYAPTFSKAPVDNYYGHNNSPRYSYGVLPAGCSFSTIQQDEDGILYLQPIVGGAIQNCRTYRSIDDGMTWTELYENLTDSSSSTYDYTYLGVCGNKIVKLSYISRNGNYSLILEELNKASDQFEQKTLIISPEIMRVVRSVCGQGLTGNNKNAVLYDEYHNRIYLFASDFPKYVYIDLNTYEVINSINLPFESSIGSNFDKRSSVAVTMIYPFVVGWVRSTESNSDTSQWFTSTYETEILGSYAGTDSDAIWVLNIEDPVPKPYLFPTTTNITTELSKNFYSVPGSRDGIYLPRIMPSPNNPFLLIDRNKYVLNYYDHGFVRVK